jgi:hypothetical protein
MDCLDNNENKDTAFMRVADKTELAKQKIKGLYFEKGQNKDALNDSFC